MFYRIPVKSLLIPNVMLCIWCATATAPVQGAGNSNESTKTIQGSVSQNEMIDNLERVGIKCVFHQGATAKTGYLAVDSVHMGSAAFYNGVEIGDKIKGLSTANDV